MNKPLMAFILSICSATALYGAGSVVKIEGGEGSWRLTLNGKPYFI